MKIFEKNRTVLLPLFAAATILLAAFIANGSEYEDAWLYISGLWIVLIPVFDIYSKKK